MLALDEQNTTWARMEAGQLEWQPGYAEAYERFQLSHEDFNQLGSEEKAKAFTQFLQDDVQNRILAIIEDKEWTEDKKRNYRHLALSGQVLLASTDQGETFTELITVADLNQVNALDYVVLSPTLRLAEANTGTTDLHEIIDEQTVLFVVSNLKDSNYTIVGQPEIKNHQVTIMVESPEGPRPIKVDLLKVATVPLEELYEDARVAQTQLPEEHGRIEEEKDITDMDSTTQMVVGTAMDDDQNRAGIAAGAVTAIAAGVADTKVKQDNANARAMEANRQRALYESEQEQIEASSTSTRPQAMQIQAAKQRVSMKRNQQDAQAERWEKRRIQNEKAMADWVKKQKKEESLRREQKKKQQNKNRAGAGLAASLGGFLGAAFSGGALFVNHINILLQTQ